MGCFKAEGEATQVCLLPFFDDGLFSFTQGFSLSLICATTEMMCCCNGLRSPSREMAPWAASRSSLTRWGA